MEAPSAVAQAPLRERRAGWTAKAPATCCGSRAPTGDSNCDIAQLRNDPGSACVDTA